MAGPDDVAVTFEPHRRRLTGLAYPMLGSLSEAEDIVQDAYLRWHATERGRVDNARAYLSRTVARLCLDHLKSARARRETYVGPWLPEPIARHASGEATTPESSAALAESLTVAFLVLLERLTPLERAAFLLREVFDRPFHEVASILGTTEAACRKLVLRARVHVDEGRSRFSASEAQKTELLQAFVHACASGDSGA